MGTLYDVKATWQEKAKKVDGYGLPCGHSIPEECPEELVQSLVTFLGNIINGPYMPISL